MNTPEGRKRGVQTMKEVHGKDIYAKIGSKGGREMHQGENAYEPMRDASYASRLAKIRWTKYRYNKGEIDKATFDERMAELTGGSTTNM